MQKIKGELSIKYLHLITSQINKSNQTIKLVKNYTITNTFKEMKKIIYFEIFGKQTQKVEAHINTKSVFYWG